MKVPEVRSVAVNDIITGLYVAAATLCPGGLLIFQFMPDEYDRLSMAKLAILAFAVSSPVFAINLSMFEYLTLRVVDRLPEVFKDRRKLRRSELRRSTLQTASILSLAPVYCVIAIKITARGMSGRTAVFIMAFAELPVVWLALFIFRATQAIPNMRWRQKFRAKMAEKGVVLRQRPLPRPAALAFDMAFKFPITGKIGRVRYTATVPSDDQLDATVDRAIKMKGALKNFTDKLVADQMANLTPPSTESGI